VEVVERRNAMEDAEKAERGSEWWRSVAPPNSKATQCKNNNIESSLEENFSLGPMADGKGEMYLGGLSDVANI
jgi:L-rhamnose mutarotase